MSKKAEGRFSETFLIFPIHHNQERFNLNFKKSISNQSILLKLTASALLFLAVMGLVLQENFSLVLEELTSKALGLFGGYYLYLGLGSVLLMVFLAIHPLSKIKLGGSQPEFGWVSWIAMLYSTGMGGGLMLRAVQEPVFYFQNPPRSFVQSKEIFALEYTFFHWGFTPWAFYGLMALLVAYNIYIKSGSALSSSALLGKFTSPWLAGALDLLTVLCTLFGVVAGVGLGSRQLLEAISYWSGIQFSSQALILPVFLVSFIAILSAYFGVRRGIKLLSNINIGGASLLLLFAWIVGNKVESVTNMFFGVSNYLLEFFPMSLNYGIGKVENSFLKDWTYFYWAFWLSWAPFTGVFIARISKGRSIRELILGTLFVPAIGTFFWFSVFGTNGMELIETGRIESTAFSSIYSSLFTYFSLFPYPLLSKFIATGLVGIFLITSIDSAIFVLSIFLDEGKEEPRKRIRLFWGVSIFTFTAGVGWLGREGILEAMSNLLILFALPFSFVFILLIIGFVRTLFTFKP